MKQKRKEYCVVEIISAPMWDLGKNKKITATHYVNKDIYHDEVDIDKLHSFPIICERIVMPITGLEYFRDVITDKIYRGKRKKDGSKYFASKEIVLEKAEKISAELVCSRLKELTADKIASYTEVIEEIESGTLEYYQKVNKKYQDEIKYIEGFNQGKKRVLSRIKENLKIKR